MTSEELRRERARIVEQMRELVDRAEGENRDLTGEERQSYERGEADYVALSGRIQRTEAVEERELAMSRSIDRPADPTGAGRDLDRGGSRDGAGHRASDLPEDAPGRAARMAFLDVVRHGVAGVDPEVRALVQNADGQILVPDLLETELIRSLPAVTVMRELVTVRPVSTNRVKRRGIDEVSVGWGKLETGTDLTDSMPNKPTSAYTYVEDLYGLAKIGEDELDDSDVGLEAYVRDSFARALGEAEDTAFTVGTGHANQQPVGWATAGGGITAVTGSSSDYAQSGDEAYLIVDDLQKLIYAVPAQARRNGAFVMSSSAELFISTRRNADGDRLWQPSTQAGRPNTFLGFAIYNQEDVAAIAAEKVIAGFGDWKRGYQILDRQGMTLQRLVELYAEDGEIGFKVRRRVGGDVRIPDALRVLKTAAAE